MEKIDLPELGKIDKNRITKVIIPKYENEDFWAAAHRVYVDDKETKFCYCSTCNCYFSADRKHLVGNIRSHFNSHATRKRTQKTTLESWVTKKTKIAISPSEIDTYRKRVTQALCIGAQPLSYFDTEGAKVLFNAVQGKILKFVLKFKPLLKIFSKLVTRFAIC